MKQIFTLFAALLLCTASYGQDRSDSLHVAHYDIHLNITDFAAHRVTGYAELRVVAKVPGISCIELDLQQLQVDSLWVNDTPNTAFSHEGYALRIPLQTAMNQNDTSVVRVYYSGQPAQDSYFGGFYFSGQYCYNLGVAFRDLPHSFGRAWYPCLDFFTDKSAYDFHIETEAGKRAVCGGLLIDSVVTASNTVIWNWHQALPVSAYLTSVAVGDYRHYADTVQGVERVIPIDIYAYPSLYDRIEGSFTHLKDVFHYYEQIYGPYPWDRVGYVGVAFNGGAMEHVANIAYPNFAFSGNATYESLYIHEFSHMWFGDLITCNRAEEMWINEGFARYNEAIADEFLYPSDDPATDGYRVNIRNLHRSVLRSAHIDDGGFWALDSMPQSVTYGTTTYDKGGLVVHALRKYMGDEAFFHSIRNYLDFFAFRNASTLDMIAFLEQDSGIDLHDFYEGWIHQPGFLHFSVDSVRATGEPGEYRFYVRQRLSNARQLANGNKLDITFFAADRRMHTVDDFRFDGEYGTGTVVLPFEPQFAVADYNECLADATIDYNFLVSGAGTFNAASANVKLHASSVADTVVVRVEDNLVAADPLKVANEDIWAVSPGHYWRVEFSNDAAVEGALRFTYQGSSDGADGALLAGHSRDEIVLLYRRDAADDWRIVPSTLSGSLSTGNLLATEVRSGEYALGLGNRAAVLRDRKGDTGMFAYPNPTADKVFFRLPAQTVAGECQVRVADSCGHVVSEQTMERNGSISLRQLPKGVYFISVSCNGNLLGASKVVRQ